MTAAASVGLAPLQAPCNPCGAPSHGRDSARHRNACEAATLKVSAPSCEDLGRRRRLSGNRRYVATLTVRRMALTGCDEARMHGRSRVALHAINRRPHASTSHFPRHRPQHQGALRDRNAPLRGSVFDQRRPPPANRCSPVSQVESSEARNVTIEAISFGWPMRPSGVLATA